MEEKEHIANALISLCKQGKVIAKCPHCETTIKNIEALKQCGMCDKSVTIEDVLFFKAEKEQIN